MDTNIRGKLEQTLTSFDRSVNMSLENSRNTNEFLMNLQTLKREYVRYLEQVMEEAGFRSPTLLDYAASQFEVLMSRYEKNAQVHGTVLVEEMQRLNKAEFEQALEVLDADDMSKEDKKVVLAQNARAKMNNLQYSKEDQRQADQTELRRLEDDLELMIQDISSRISKVFTAGLNNRQFASRGAEIETELYYLRSYIDSRVNNNFLERYRIAMDEHTQGIMTELEAKNEVWNQELDKILEEIEKAKMVAEISEHEKEDNPFDISDEHEKSDETLGEVSLTETEEEKSNPFELSDSYKRKVEEVGKAPTKKKTAAEVYKELSELF